MRQALELALEALENSVDLVVGDAYNAEQLYGNYPTRQGKVGGLKVLAEQHKQAITAMKELLAQLDQDEVDIRSRLYQRIHELETQLAQPEDKKCENCGEFGECCQLAQPERPTCFADWQDAHATDRGCGNCHLRTECRTGQPEQESVTLKMDVIVVNLVREGINKHRARELAEHFIKHTTPPQRKPLTDEMRKQMKERCDSMEMRGAFADGWMSSEAAHGIKE